MNQIGKTRYFLIAMQLTVNGQLDRGEEALVQIVNKGESIVIRHYIDPVSGLAYAEEDS